MPDNAAIGRLAREHFTQRGFRHFSFYARSGSVGETLRREAFRQEVEACGFEMHCLDWPAETPDDPADPGPPPVTWLTDHLNTLPKPLAVFAEYDDRAIEVLEACEIAGLAVPEEVAVLGTDDDDLRCTFAPVELSSIDDDQIAQGYTAARLLDQLMSGQQPPAQTLVSPRGVTVRKSSDIVATNHAQVAHALRLIWRHYTEPISAKEVAAEVPLSYRRLHEAFLEHVGRSIAEELTLRRLQHAKSLLKESTDLKLEQIAQSSGFGSHNHMTKVFSRVLGITPSSYRRGQTS
jgi:LacI family transcriptional regulator